MGKDCTPSITNCQLELWERKKTGGRKQEELKNGVVYRCVMEGMRQDGRRIARDRWEDKGRRIKMGKFNRERGFREEIYSHKCEMLCRLSFTLKFDSNSSYSCRL